MKVILSALGIAVLSAAVARAQEPTPMTLHEEPQSLPELVFADEAGEPRSLEDWRGKVVLLNVWATWCAPCRAEMPTLDRLRERLGGERFDVVALSVDRAGARAVRKFFDEVGVGIPVFIDQDGAAIRSLRLFGLPATLLIGPYGNELARLAGPAEWDAAEMVAFFEGIIERELEETGVRR
ncbi:MAG: TlpA family protein disulfide reductase [Mesorhizobium sp.]|uniref:TlpA family protein disulfide reductase n=1 Tax=Mesorhizobium sp. TaxID=1871066 RepID=UPI00121218C1|nr:TlpA disulfide reductase family protein [Mesorhizobium sp.]TIP25761.1 MAG: TlpA family protein disulfide reductase [Mesorhizobium sp.]